MIAEEAVLRTALSGWPCRRGKVRDVYDLGDRLLIVATDRISAFDVVLPTGIPGKGRVLTRLSEFWFNMFADEFPHHLLSVLGAEVPDELAAHADVLSGRSMLCRKCSVVPIECVVRGYITGSGWKDYRQTGTVCGHTLPAGLERRQRLPEPLFTPSTKAETGHDENITFEQAWSIAAAPDTMDVLRQRSVELYCRAADYAVQRGVIIADTKFEWGVMDGQLILIDEVLTPDSSRFWTAEDYAAGREQDSFDKQFVRNYLEALCAEGRWDKTPPGPVLPENIVSGTASRYADAYHRLTGQVLPR